MDPELLRFAVTFEPQDPPRTGGLVFRSDGPDGPARIPVTEAVPALVRTRDSRARHTHPAALPWASAAVLALRLIARGRMYPGVSAGGFDAWRVGPLGPEDIERVRELAAEIAAESRIVPKEYESPGASPPSRPDAYALVRRFLDAVADGMARTPAAVLAAGGRTFAAPEPQWVPELRGWAEEISAGADSGLGISLRLEITGDDIERASFRVVTQVHVGADDVDHVYRPASVTDASDLWRAAAVGDGGYGAGARLDTMLAVRRAARVWPPLERLLERAVPDATELTDGEVEELLSGTASRLAAAGVDVYWPTELVRDMTARAVVGDASPAGDRGRDRARADGLRAPHDHGRGGSLGGMFGGLLAFNWQLATGGQALTEAEMDRLAEATRPVVRLRDQWMLVDPTLARKARVRALTPLTPIAALGAVLTGTAEIDGEQVQVAATGWLDALRERLVRPITEPEERMPVVQPAALAGTLRGYQLDGLRWLERMTSLGLGGCLADDMGLGKTVTVIALHLHRHATAGERAGGPTLVVCPASLLGTWEREITRFAPAEAVRRFHGSGRSVDGEGVGFVLTTYGTMRRDAGRLGAVQWGLVVADEAQHVKNPRSQGAKALRTIPADARVALTGTPVENNLTDLWAILDWTTPGLLGSLSTFRARWAGIVEGDTAGTAAAEFALLVRPFLLRRRKSDPGIAPELPPKTVTDQPVALTNEQAALYEAVVRETMAQIKVSTGMSRRGLVVKLLTELKQICNHPAQYLKESGSPLQGRSGKLEILDELVDTISAEGGAVLVFTQYVAMARLIERHLAGRGVPVQLLHGGTPVRRREEMVRRFQESAAGAVPIFLLSLRAAGTGLNLTRADHVMHYDRWWNPAVEEQATDRAYRIGQTRPVQVHRLIAEGTVEDRIAAMLESKRELADAVLGTADTEAALTELSDAELASLVQLRGAG